MLSGLSKSDFLFFLLKVKESVQRLPNSGRAVRAGVPPVCAVRCAALRGPVHLGPGVRLRAGPGYDVRADVGLHPLLGPLPGCGRSHRPGGRRCAGAGQMTFVW